MRTHNASMHVGSFIEQRKRSGYASQAAATSRARTRAGVIILIAIMVLGIAAFFVYGNAASASANPDNMQAASANETFDESENAACGQESANVSAIFDAGEDESSSMFDQVDDDVNAAIFDSDEGSSSNVSADTNVSACIMDEG